MIAFPGILASAAEKAGMLVPNNPDKWQQFKNKYPHFFVFCAVQLGKSCRYPGEHWDNAKVIAKIPSKDIMKVSLEDLEELGFIN